MKKAPQDKVSHLLNKQIQDKISNISDVNYISIIEDSIYIISKCGTIDIHYTGNTCVFNHKSHYKITDISDEINIHDPYIVDKVYNYILSYTRNWRRYVYDYDMPKPRKKSKYNIFVPVQQSIQSEYTDILIKTVSNIDANIKVQRDTFAHKIWACYKEYPTKETHMRLLMFVP